MICLNCQKEFIPTAPHCKYCSPKCHSRASYLRKKQNGKNKCIICGKLTVNPKFCSNKCFVSVARMCQPKPRFCQKCGVKISDKWTNKKLCAECKTHRPQAVNCLLTLAELRQKLSTSQYHAAIRMDARILYKPTGTCVKCGYNKHTNVCHIKPLHKFSMDTLVSTVNDLSNLTELCPNCHWEFDHPTVSLERVELSRQF